ncbi:hypothetical protein L2E82_07502 [Cichorium intybus]|uniref:Uncharacterized protein n=1 Tax=Cichorium intybus TaxID=13427 RepID=A0ACB9G444_CICIN|nr:hypothetical protein L2E82_07502 [Cichorium intybus]
MLFLTLSTLFLPSGRRFNRRSYRCQFSCFCYVSKRIMEHEELKGAVNRFIMKATGTHFWLPFSPSPNTPISPIELR